MAILMIFMPASTPMGHHNLWPLFPDAVAHLQRTLLVERDFSIGILQKDRFCPKQSASLPSCRPLHLPVLLNRNIFRSSFLSDRKAQENTGASALDLLGHDGAHGESASPGCAAIAMILPGFVPSVGCAHADELAKADNIAAPPAD